MEIDKLKKATIYFQFMDNNLINYVALIHLLDIRISTMYSDIDGGTGYSKHLNNALQVNPDETEGEEKSL
jgi:hypothetical protein